MKRKGTNSWEDKTMKTRTKKIRKKGEWEEKANEEMEQKKDLERMRQGKENGKRAQGKKKHNKTSRTTEKWKRNGKGAMRQKWRKCWSGKRRGSRAANQRRNARAGRDQSRRGSTRTRARPSGSEILFQNAQEDFAVSEFQFPTDILRAALRN